jgi:hypothetical protein
LPRRRRHQTPGRRCRTKANLAIGGRCRQPPSSMAIIVATTCGGDWAGDVIEIIQAAFRADCRGNQ